MGLKILLMVQHNTWIDERQNAPLLRAPNKTRLLGRVTQGVAPGHRITASWNSRGKLMYKSGIICFLVSL